jgi:hypothetical protein
MSHPLPLSSQSEPENKCPACLSIKLEGMVIQSEKQGMFQRQTKLPATDQIRLYLNLQFNEQEEQLPNGRLKFGISGGKLTLKLENERISLTSPILNGSFALSEQQDRQNQEGNDFHRCVTVSFCEKKPGIKGNLGTQKIAGKTQHSELSVAQVSPHGSQHNPSWVFVAENDNSILKGLFKRTLLGSLNVTAKPCRIEAIFCVSPHDIKITDMAGLLPYGISQKKRVIIERAIARRLLKQKMNPYLSRQELRYDG